MNTEILKNKIMKKLYFNISCIIILVINFNCSSKREYTFNQLKDIHPKFIIKDSLIVNEVTKLINNKKMKVNKNEFISIKINKDQSLKNYYYLEITKKLFTVEKRRALNKNLCDLNYKDFILYNDYLMLLYGDINDFFEIEKRNLKNDIFFIKNKTQIEKFGIVYDPPIFKYEIVNGKLILISEF
jgi:hypothetical protein